VARPAPQARRSRPGKPRYRQAHRREPTSTSYPSDLTDAEWALIEALFSQQGKRGRPSLYGQRALLNGIFYVLRSGCSWRMLPHDLPPWSTVHKAFKRWAKNGLLEETCHHLRREWRKDHGRQPEPTAAIADSQSAKTTEKGGPAAMTAASK
jgi:putative transposase